MKGTNPMLKRFCFVLLAAVHPTDGIAAPAPTCDVGTPTLSILNAVINRTFNIYSIGGAIVFRGSLGIDADGAPEAYFPDDSKTLCPANRDKLHEAHGLDCLPNAGFPGKPYAIASSKGVLLKQGADDPAPGYYVSKTALSFGPANKQRSYVDSSRVPYLAMPGGKRWHTLAASLELRLGDVGVVVRQGTSTPVSFILADQGNSLEGKHASLAEGSIALANQLGVPSNPRRGGTSRRDFLFVLFPRSGTRAPLIVDEIIQRSNALLIAWGGAPKLADCQEEIR
jgi:hypothetical protein